MTVQARNRSQAEDSLRFDRSLSDPQSTTENVESNMSAPHPWQQLTQMITSYWVSRPIYIAAKLRIADHLKDGPRTAEELAVTAGVAPRPLYRVLRALAGLGVFAHEADSRFRLNRLAGLLAGVRGLAGGGAVSLLGRPARDRPHRRAGLRAPLRPAALR